MGARDRRKRFIGSSGSLRDRSRSTLFAGEVPGHDYLANGAWIAMCALAHNLIRWVAKIGSGIDGIVVAKTQRNRLFDIPGPMTTHGRKKTLHLPERWPWAKEFLSALAKLRALPSG